MPERLPRFKPPGYRLAPRSTLFHTLPRQPPRALHQPKEPLTHPARGSSSARHLQHLLPAPRISALRLLKERSKRSHCGSEPEIHPASCRTRQIRISAHQASRRETPRLRPTPLIQGPRNRLQRLRCPLPARGILPTPHRRVPLSTLHRHHSRHTGTRFRNGHRLFGSSHWSPGAV